MAKILRLENIGRFTNLTGKGNVEFQRLTLIYGENGAGKTTLAGVFRSLATGDAAYVNERATLGANAAPIAEVRVSGATVRLDGGKWSQTHPNFEIFDSTFVSENVYTGDHVDLEHRKNLYEVVVGATAVRLAGRINAIDSESRATARTVSNLEASIRGSMQGPFNLATFLQLESESEIEQRIAEVTAQLNAVRKSKEIVARPQLQQLSAPAAPRHVVDVLKATVDTAARQAEQKVRDHVQQHLDSFGEQWLRQGIRYVRNEKCPLCLQSITGLDAIRLMSEFFSKSYEDQVVKIQRAVNEIDQTFSEAVLGSLQQRGVENNGHVATWKDLADLSYASDPLTSLTQTWRHLRELLGVALKRKLENPFDTSADFVLIEAAFQDYEKDLDGLMAQNRLINRANDEITRLKKQAAASDESQLEEELRRLRNVQIRADPAVDALCTKLQEARDNKGLLEAEKRQARAELEKESNAVLAAYEKDVNDFLASFGASFRITGTKPSFAGGPASSTFKIELNGVQLDLGDSETPRGTPCFRTALSAGDKSTLALAFFMSRLRRDANIARKIVVFDDPLSSLDCFRRTFTQLEVVRIARQTAQVIVLSHDAFFLKGILSDADGLDSKTLEVARAGGTYMLREWDIEKFCLAEAHQDYFLLRSFLENGIGGRDVRTVAKARRRHTSV